MTELRLNLGKHIEKMDRLASDFDKLAEKTSKSDQDFCSTSTSTLTDMPP